MSQLLASWRVTSVSLPPATRSSLTRTNTDHSPEAIRALCFGVVPGLIILL